jgi:hypothetical protein
MQGDFMADMFKLEYSMGDEIRVTHINLDNVKSLDIEKAEEDDFYTVFAYHVGESNYLGYPMSKEQAIKQGFLKE